MAPLGCRRGKRCRGLTGACRAGGEHISSATQMQRPPMKVASAEDVMQIATTGRENLTWLPAPSDAMRLSTVQRRTPFKPIGCGYVNRIMIGGRLWTVAN